MPRHFIKHFKNITDFLNSNKPFMLLKNGEWLVTHNNIDCIMQITKTKYEETLTLIPLLKDADIGSGGGGIKTIILKSN